MNSYPPKTGACTWLCHVPFYLAILLLAGCAATPQTEALLSGRTEGTALEHELADVPFFPQDEYQCGPAALATVLADSGVAVTPKQLVPMVYVPERKGSFQVEMMAAARRHDRIPYRIEPELKAVVTEVKAGHPVLVLQNLGLDWYPRWHYAVVVGYDVASGDFILRSGDIKRRVTAFKTFENTWGRSQFWGFVLLKPGELPASGREKDYFLAVSEYAEQGTEQQVYAAMAAGLERWPESKYLLMGVGNHYARNQELEHAVMAYEKVLEVEPDYAPAHNNLAWVLGEQGNYAAARLHAEKAVELGGPYLEQYRLTLSELEKVR